MYSKRIQNIVYLVVEDNNIADIGSDHGYVLISLRNKGFKSQLLGVENKLAPFKNLQKNLVESDINDINTSLSDGLEQVSSEYKTIVIAGMGYETIESIINKSIDKIKNIKYFIIDAHTNFKKIRPFFIKLGFKIDNELIINEDSIYYQLIRFVKTNEIINYSKQELNYGPLNLKRKEDEFVKFIRDEISNRKTILAKIPQNNEKALSLLKEIKELEAII